MAARTAGTRAREAYELGRAGATAPAWVTRDSAYGLAYDQGRAAAAARTASKPAPAPRRSGRGSRGARARAELRDVGSDTVTAADELVTGSGRKLRGWMPGGRLTAADAGGALLGLIIYAQFLAYLRHGPDGLRGWWRAKWLNDPMPGASGKTDRTAART